MQHRRPVVTHVVGGVGIALGGDFAFSDERRRIAATSADLPAIVVHLDAARTPVPHRPDGAPVVEADSWVAFREGDVIKLCVKDTSRAIPEAMRIELPRDGLNGRYFYDHDHPYPFQHPIDQLLVVHALGVTGGALMHAAAICGRDGALLVAGPSGAGKTTMSRSAAALGAPVLSDERTILRPAPGGGWLLGGTSWPGEGGFAENRSVPLRGLILLEQADHDALVAVSPARALALLYRCHFPPLWDPIGCERTVDNLERVVREVPAFLYRNQKAPDAARLLLSQVGGVA
jgi:hypothetical protein